MRNKTKALLRANIDSALRPFVGLNIETGRERKAGYTGDENRVHMTPYDLALHLVNALDERGFSIRLKK